MGSAAGRKRHLGSGPDHPGPEPSRLPGGPPANHPRTFRYPLGSWRKHPDHSAGVGGAHFSDFLAGRIRREIPFLPHGLHLWDGPGYGCVLSAGESYPAP